MTSRDTEHTRSDHTFLTLYTQVRKLGVGEGEGSLSGIPSALVNSILHVSGVPAHVYWERRGQLLVEF